MTGETGDETDCVLLDAELTLLEVDEGTVAVVVDRLLLLVDEEAEEE